VSELKSKFAPYLVKRIDIASLVFRVQVQPTSEASARVIALFPRKDNVGSTTCTRVKTTFSYHGGDNGTDTAQLQVQCRKATGRHQCRSYPRADGTPDGLVVRRCVALRWFATPSSLVSRLWATLMPWNLKRTTVNDHGQSRAYLHYLARLDLFCDNCCLVFGRMCNFTFVCWPGGDVQLARWRTQDTRGASTCSLMPQVMGRSQPTGEISPTNVGLDRLLHDTDGCKT